jgi:hypothetical protein
MSHDGDHWGRWRFPQNWWKVARPFWTKKSQIHQEYGKVQGFWLPLKNESVSYIRLGGRATLTIEYTDYRVQDALQPSAATQSTQATIH